MDSLSATVSIGMTALARDAVSIPIKRDERHASIMAYALETIANAACETLSESAYAGMLDAVYRYRQANIIGHDSQSCAGCTRHGS